MATVTELFAAAWHNHQAGALTEAEQLYRQIIQADPRHADAFHLLGVLAYQTGRFDMAVASIAHALALAPSVAAFHSNLALALQALGRANEAVASYYQALRLDPGFADAHNGLGFVLRLQGKLEDAATHLHEALRLRPDFAEAHDNLGNVLFLQKRHNEAVACYRQALRLNPNFVDAHNDLGVALSALGQAAEAIACYQQALRLNPRYAKAHTNLGAEYVDMARWDEALACFDQALRLDPNYAKAHLYRGGRWLALGEWAKGWPEYEWRFRVNVDPPPFPQPRWDGAPLAGRTLLVAAEQGLGDTLQFVRYVPMLRQRGDKVIFQCPPSLHRLLSQSLTDVPCVPQRQSLLHFDVYVPLLSLPGILGTTLTNVPAQVPYLQAEASLVEHWRQKMSGVWSLASGVNANDSARQTPDTRRFLIGIAWQGNPDYAGDRKRSIPLAHFAPLADTPGVQLISLQKGFGTEQIQGCAKRFAVVNLGAMDESAGAFMDTAAIMKNLDLVITSDTAIPHLAGALAVPVWVALPEVPDWRWLLHREDCPWYPTMRLFRQREVDDWRGVFEGLARELKAAVTAMGSGSIGGDIREQEPKARPET